MNLHRLKADAARGLFAEGGEPCLPPVDESSRRALAAAGVHVLKKFVGGAQCPVTEEQLLSAVRGIIRRAPLYTPLMRSGTPFRYRMSNAGPLGWVSDRRGYRYEPLHPITGRPWPPIPQAVLDVIGPGLRSVGIEGFRPEACLVNLYSSLREALGMHVDDTEENLTAPIFSISLGDVGVFMLGGHTPREEARQILLESGDVLIMAGEARLRRHGVKGIVPGTSRLLKHGGRINLTIRQVY